MCVLLSVEYPSAAPIASVGGLPENLAALLIERIEQCAVENLGQSMLHTLIASANEFIRDRAPSSSPCENDLSGEDAALSNRCGNEENPSMATQIRGIKDKSPDRASSNTAQKAGPRDEMRGVDDIVVAKKHPMKEANEVIHRIQWDPDLNPEEFVVGYLDRFVGVIEKPFSDFAWKDISVGALSIPQHRIQYFKFRGDIVWDKVQNFDNVFGSRGVGTTISDFL